MGLRQEAEQRDAGIVRQGLSLAKHDRYAPLVRLEANAITKAGQIGNRKRNLLGRDTLIQKPLDTKKGVAELGRGVGIPCQAGLRSKPRRRRIERDPWGAGKGVAKLGEVRREIAGNKRDASVRLGEGGAAPPRFKKHVLVEEIAVGPEETSEVSNQRRRHALLCASQECVENRQKTRHRPGISSGVACVLRRNEHFEDGLPGVLAEQALNKDAPHQPVRRPPRLVDTEGLFLEAVPRHDGVAPHSAHVVGKAAPPECSRYLRGKHEPPSAGGESFIDHGLESNGTSFGHAAV